jgi:hypothetical protein
VWPSLPEAEVVKHLTALERPLLTAFDPRRSVRIGSDVRLYGKAYKPKAAQITHAPGQRQILDASGSTAPP